MDIKKINQKLIILMEMEKIINQVIYNGLLEKIICKKQVNKKKYKIQ